MILARQTSSHRQDVVRINLEELVKELRSLKHCVSRLLVDPRGSERLSASSPTRRSLLTYLVLRRLSSQGQKTGLTSFTSSLAHLNCNSGIDQPPLGAVLYPSSVTDNNHVTVPLPVPRHDGPSLASAGPPLPAIIGDGLLPSNKRDSLVRIFDFPTSSGFFSLSSSILSTHAVRSTYFRRRRTRTGAFIDAMALQWPRGGSMPTSSLPSHGRNGLVLSQRERIRHNDDRCGSMQPWSHGSMKLRSH